MVYDSDEEEDSSLKSMLADEHLIKLVEVVSKPEGLFEQDTSLFEMIQRITNSKQSAAELQRKYKDMTTSEEDKSKNIDYEALKSRVCRRCYLINCDMHPQPEIVQKGSQLKEISPTNDEEPCGDNCYKLNWDVAGVSHLNQDPWSIADSSLFKITYQMFGKSFCRIATCIDSKTCKMVYDYAQIPANLPEVGEYSADVKTEGSKKRKLTKDSSWLSKIRTAQKGIEKQTYHNSYVPCNCVVCDKDCPFTENFCEKFCHCPQDCIHRFRGCKCKAECKTNACPCWNADRECDIDICKCKMPFHKTSGESKCLNCAVQLGKWKHLVMKPSTVVKGWGCFIKDGAKKRKFITVNRQVY